MSEKKKVLVVDDDVPLAGLMHELLDNFGYEATSLNNSLEALKLYQDSGEQFDLVITDQTMPGMTGVELSTAILEHNPQQVIMLCTGFSEHVDEERALALGIKGFLQKPMDTKAMIAEVKRLLGD